MDVLQEVLSACHVDSLEMQKEMQDFEGISIDQLQPSFTLNDFSHYFNELQPVDTQQQPPIFNQPSLIIVQIGSDHCCTAVQL